MTTTASPELELREDQPRPVADALTMTWRNLLNIRRNPQLLVFATVQPGIFVLKFRYVFGGAIAIPGTELSGSFEPCEFCALGNGDRELLRVFLASKGNMKEVERHLGVSYPTARARYDELLGRLELRPAAEPASDPIGDVLEARRRGELSVDEAERRLS
jgi:hypothetical protein